MTFQLFDNINPPNCAVNVSPVDSAAAVFVNTDLTWASGGGAPTGYKTLLWYRWRWSYTSYKPC